LDGEGWGRGEKHPRMRAAELVLYFGEGMGELLEGLQCPLLPHFGDGVKDEGIAGDGLTKDWVNRKYAITTSVVLRYVIRSCEIRYMPLQPDTKIE
jgi:hypothetical protein